MIRPDELKQAIERVEAKVNEDGSVESRHSFLQIADIRTLIDAARQAEAWRAEKDQAYEERNRLVALLAAIFPAGRRQTDIPGWNPEWHGCVYIDFPWGQASWHFHDSQSSLFAFLPPYRGEWDGHTTEAKYQAISDAIADGSALPAPEPKGQP